jgi:SAM-dependent methyltransferase
MSADRRARDGVEGPPSSGADDAAPPDVDSLMSRLDGQPTSDRSGDRGSDPGRPSAAALLGRNASKRRRGNTIRVPDDQTPPPPPVRGSKPPPRTEQAAATAVMPEPPTLPSFTMPKPAPAPSTPPGSEPIPLVASQVTAAARPVSSPPPPQQPSQQPSQQDVVRITPTRMISVGAASGSIPPSPRATIPDVPPPPPPEGDSVPSLVAAAVSTFNTPSSRPASNPPPRPISQPPTKLNTPYPMASPFTRVGPAPEIVIRPMPVPAAAMSSQPIEPVAPNPNLDISPQTPLPPPPAKTPTLTNLDATVREALDLLDREDFETTGIDIALVPDDEPTAPRLPAVQLPPASDREESLSDDEVIEEVAPPTTAKSGKEKVAAAPAPPPRRPGVTGKQPQITAELASPAKLVDPSAAATLPSARITETTPQPSTGPVSGVQVAATPSGPTSGPTAAAAATLSSSEATGELKKKKRQWYEDLFNDDFQRTMPRQPASFLDREVGFIEDSLGCEKGATILDLGCGPGEHAVRLAKRGYEVIGIDLSLAMLARAADEATELQQRINFVQGDMRDLTFEDAFDGVYCWGTTFGYFDEQKNIEVIQKVHKALRRGGRLLLDVVNRDYVIGRSPSMAWFEGEGCVCMDEMMVNAITSRLQVKRTMMMEDGRQREIDYSIRLYALHELGKMLHDSGFRVAEASGDTSTPGVYFGAESPRILILAEKR